MLPLLVLLLLFVFLGIDSGAQCAMCKATAESATEHVNKGIGQGLNSGIIYLMMVPYLILATIAGLFFKQNIIRFFKPIKA